VTRRYLRYGTRSVSELRAHLASRGVSEDAIADVVCACERAGALDDRVCAKLIAAARAAKGYASGSIREHLAGKGLARGVVESAVRSIQAETTDEERARTVVRTRLSRRLEASVRLRLSLARVLARRGFDEELIDRVLREALGSEDA